MKGPTSIRTLVIGDVFGSIINVEVFSANRGYITIREEKRRWKNRVEKKGLQVDPSLWEVHPTNEDRSMLKSLKMKHGLFDLVLLHPLHFYGIKHTQKSLDSYMADVQLYSCTLGERLFWTPGAVLFAVPRGKKFKIQKQEGNILIEREFILRSIGFPIHLYSNVYPKPQMIISIKE
jgi:hypothetical protein